MSSEIRTVPDTHNSHLHICCSKNLMPHVLLKGQIQKRAGMLDLLEDSCLSTIDVKFRNPSGILLGGIIALGTVEHVGT